MNLFENIKSNKDMRKDFNRIYQLYAVNKIYEFENKTIREVINDNYFFNWNHRNTFISLYDLEKELNLYFDENIINNLSDIELEEKLMIYLELILNITYPLEFKYCNSILESYRYQEDLNVLLDNIIKTIDKYGYEEKEIDDFIYIIPKNILIKNIEENINDIKLNEQIYKYLSFGKTHNLIEKKKILCYLGTYIENINFDKSNNQLLNSLKEAKFLLNNFGIRHSANKNAEEILSCDKTVEKIYDLTFDKIMIFLILNNNSINNEFFKKLHEIIDK